MPKGDAFIHTVFVEGYWPHRDQHFAFTALVAETIAVYYWSEAFCDDYRGQRRAFCVIGQRGLSEYAARAIHKVVEHIYDEANNLHENWGWKFGSAVALRDALRLRRDKETEFPEYQEQCNVSTYRAKRQLNHNYKVGSKDTPVNFEIDGFARGRRQVWTLKQFLTPVQVLDRYARSQQGK